MAKQTTTGGDAATKRKRIGQVRPHPPFVLEETLTIAEAIAENNACKPYSRLSIAESVGRSPESSGFRELITSSNKYGLTEGGYQAPSIKLTDLGQSIVAPKTDEEKRSGLIQAVFNIELYKRLFEHFDQHKIPPIVNFKNTLMREFSVDPEWAEDCATQFIKNGKFVGLIRNIAGEDRVSIHDAGGALIPKKEKLDIKGPEDGITPPEVTDTFPKPELVKSENDSRIFIAHGKNKEILSQIKDLVTFGKYTPVIAEEHETTSKPVPEKVLDDMRSCGAGIIHIASAASI